MVPILRATSLRERPLSSRARRFLRTPNPALGGRSPLEISVNEAGLEAAFDLSDNLEEGVYL